MVGKHVVDNSSRRCCGKSVRAGEGSEGNKGLPQGPATAPRPGRVIEQKGRAEGLPAFSSEERPRDRQVTSEIPHTRASEVDHRAQPALLDQEVPDRDVAVDP